MLRQASMRLARAGAQQVRPAGQLSANVGLGVRGQATMRLARGGPRQVRPAGRLPANVAVGVGRLATSAQTVRATPNTVLVVGVATLAVSGMGYCQVTYAKAATVDFIKVREEIAEALGDDPNMGPTVVRLAWHSSGTWEQATKTGGSNGATMRFSPECAHGANAGLDRARDFLEPFKKAHPEISYADLWILAGIVAIEEMGGPKIPFVSGRVDKPDGTHCPPDGRLPDAHKDTDADTIQHVRDIFYRMGFNDQEIVALIGAHAVGRCHMTASGYDGPWTHAETTFSNEFYHELLDENWTVRKWDGPEQYTDESGELMMLPADMAIKWDPEFRKWAEIYGKDEERFFKDFTAAFSRLINFGVPVDESKEGPR